MKQKKDNVTTISLQKYFSDSRNLPFSNVYYMFSMSLSEITKKEKRKNENKFECFRQVVA